MVPLVTAFVACVLRLSIVLNDAFLQKSINSLCVSPFSHALPCGLYPDHTFVYHYLVHLLQCFLCSLAVIEFDYHVIRFPFKVHDVTKSNEIIPQFLIISLWVYITYE